MDNLTCIHIIADGDFSCTDTTTITMTCALSLLLNHKEALKTVQQEIEVQIGRDRQLNESDLKNLPYLHAVIKEPYGSTLQHP